MSVLAEDLKSAEIIWNYMFVKHELVKSDVIIGLRHHVHNKSFDEVVAMDAAQLYLRGYAPLIVFSGGVPVHSRNETHGNSMKAKAVQMGVPEAAIVIEEGSTNSGDDISFTQQLLTSKNKAHESIILVHKPYMLRRDFATFMKQWSGAKSSKVVCWASPVTLSQYLENDSLPPEEIIAIMIGDLQRIIEYPELGFQIEQPVTEEVLSAFDHLVHNGYTGHLFK